MKLAEPRRKAPSKAAIRRAVASSTAIETGKPVRVLEEMLRQSAEGKYRDVKLANGAATNAGST